MSLWNSNKFNSVKEGVLGPMILFYYVWTVSMLFDMKYLMTVQLCGQTYQGITCNINTDCSQVVHKVTDAKFVGYEDLEVLIDIYMY